ncbi:MAG TPA: hypothetical protein VK879_05400 [Candidatus Sulfomarinibacteraceae bacterium]|nr:hypothetical protein [Candidatus Sulfomarinibacteraceae bacterium]
MVHALKEIHRLLAPAGRLIDIHPFAEAPVIEIHQGGLLTFSEPVPEYAVEAIQHAEKALADVIGCGLFAVEGAHQFDFRTYASSVAELQAFLADQDSLTGDPRDEAAMAQNYEALAAHIEQLMQAAGEGADVVFHERVHMALLRPSS